MTDMQSANTPQPAVLVKIALTPLEDEEDNFETLSAVEEVTAAVWSETTAIEGYMSRLDSNSSRSVGVILLLGEIARGMIAQKDLLIALLQAGSIAISTLAKQKRVKKIEMTLDGDSISIEDPDKATVQTLLALFETKHPGKVAEVTPSSILQVTGSVSQK